MNCAKWLMESLYRVDLSLPYTMEFLIQARNTTLKVMNCAKYLISLYRVDCLSSHDGILSSRLVNTVFRIGEGTKYLLSLYRVLPRVYSYTMEFSHPGSHCFRIGMKCQSI
ncbi:hypothetical protein AVEN_45582-1 [Araneus ventricosus]|uniref:Uncharacterized protein n=1 Tax=Araneus ventricosus TaxID=182803 RepID=A0A4Y2UIM8_ARAVE|nr:hypothetical protein AVEN_45582-1 [Araneus ventricosus]